MKNPFWKLTVHRHWGFVPLYGCVNTEERKIALADAQEDMVASASENGMVLDEAQDRAKKIIKKNIVAMGKSLPEKNTKSSSPMLLQHRQQMKIKRHLPQMKHRCKKTTTYGIAESVVVFYTVLYSFISGRSGNISASLQTARQRPFLFPVPCSLFPRPPFPFSLFPVP